MIDPILVAANLENVRNAFVDVCNTIEEHAGEDYAEHAEQLLFEAMNGLVQAFGMVVVTEEVDMEVVH